MTYYNEIEPYAAEWLRRLATAGHIEQGVVDARDIREVAGSDLGGHSQAHFFAGLGGWSYALRLAGWPAGEPVWTGSCPCQPFSAAGRKKGIDDARHLWPEWFRLIAECRPPVIFGEQVAGPDGLKWLDLVSSDLEQAGYAFGAADLCAAGVGAPHIRQRLYFVAFASEQRREGIRVLLQPGQPRPAGTETAGGGEAGVLGHSSGQGPSVGQISDDGRPALRIKGATASEAGIVRGPWSPADLIRCQDGRYRPVEPGSFPLADGVPARVGKLRAFGNAIVPQVAATFIRAVAS